MEQTQRSPSLGLNCRPVDALMAGTFGGGTVAARSFGFWNAADATSNATAAGCTPLTRIFSGFQSPNDAVSGCAKSATAQVVAIVSVRQSLLAAVRVAKPTLVVAAAATATGVIGFQASIILVADGTFHNRFELFHCNGAD